MTNHTFIRWCILRIINVYFYVCLYTAPLRTQTVLILHKNWQSEISQRKAQEDCDLCRCIFQTLQSQNLRDGDNPSSQDTSTCSTADLFQKFLQQSHITEWGLQKHQHLEEQDIFSGSIHNQQSVKCLLWIQRVYYMEPIIFINFSCLVEVSHKKLSGNMRGTRTD